MCHNSFISYVSKSVSDPTAPPCPTSRAGQVRRFWHGKSPCRDRSFGSRVVDLAFQVVAMNLHFAENFGAHYALISFRIRCLHHLVFPVGILFIKRDDFGLMGAVFLINPDGAAHLTSLIVEGVPLAKHLADLGLTESGGDHKKE